MVGGETGGVSGGSTTGGTGAVLRDPALDAALAGDRLVVSPLLDAEQVAELLALHDEFTTGDERGIVLDFMQPDRSVMRALFGRLMPFWDRHLPELFRDHEVIVTSFVTKYPDDDSAMILHSEPTFVDETEHATFNVWIPLVDVGPDTDNGGLQVVPGSASLPVGATGFDTPVLIRPYERYLRAHLVTVTATAGSAVIYDTRLLHASEPNRSNVPRVALAATVAPRGAELHHVLAVGRRHRVDHVVDRDFFLDVHPNDIAAGMPARYPAVREFDDSGTLRPDDVAICVDPSSTPVPAAVIPPDLVRGDDSAQLDMLGVRPAQWVDPGVDLQVDASSLVEAPLAGLDCVDRVGSVVVAPLDAVPGIEPPASRSGRWWRRRPASRLLVAGPSSRITLRASRSGEPVDLTVLECPFVRSGARTATAAAAFDLGVRVPIGDEPVLVWNDGPGPVVALLEVAPRARR